MTQANPQKQLSIWQFFLQTIQKILKKIRNLSRSFDAIFPNTIQMIQLSFIYFAALIDLLYAIFLNVLTLGYNPAILEPVMPFIKGVLLNPWLRFWMGPEKLFFLSYVVIEFMVIRSSFRFSKLIRYNILLIFALLMIQGLVVSYWDLMFHREVSISVVKILYGRGTTISSDKSLAISFFFNTFFIFFFLYSYLYLRAMQGKFATLPAMEWLTDSIAFWLRIKTPTMRLGRRKGDKNEKRK